MAEIPAPGKLQLTKIDGDPIQCVSGAHPWVSDDSAPYVFTVVDNATRDRVATFATLDDSKTNVSPKWTVAIPAGRNIRFALTDNANVTFTGISHVVQASSDTSCFQDLLDNPRSVTDAYWTLYRADIQKLIPNADFSKVDAALAPSHSSTSTTSSSSSSSSSASTSFTSLTSSTPDTTFDLPTSSSFTTFTSESSSAASELSSLPVETGISSTSASYFSISAQSSSTTTHPQHKPGTSPVVVALSSAGALIILLLMGTIIYRCRRRQRHPTIYERTHSDSMHSFSPMTELPMDDFKYKPTMSRSSSPLTISSADVPNTMASIRHPYQFSHRSGTPLPSAEATTFRTRNSGARSPRAAGTTVIPQHTVWSGLSEILAPSAAQQPSEQSRPASGLHLNLDTYSTWTGPSRGPPTTIF